MGGTVMLLVAVPFFVSYRTYDILSKYLIPKTRSWLSMTRLIDVLQSEVNRLTVQSEQIESTLKTLRGTIKSLANGNHRRKFSVAIRERMAAGQRRRWAKVFAKRKKAAA